jgi:3'-phosphoadenosine 5'-phosphosulfate sulfotransferase (PAPS reductase)/FAD synthetase
LIEFPEHLLKKKNLLALLCDGERFKKGKGFMKLNPIYDVSAIDIQEYIKQKLLEKK